MLALGQPKQAKGQVHSSVVLNPSIVAILLYTLCTEASLPGEDYFTINQL